MNILQLNSPNKNKKNNIILSTTANQIENINTNITTTNINTSNKKKNDKIIAQ